MSEEYVWVSEQPRPAGKRCEAESGIWAIKRGGWLAKKNVNSLKNGAAATLGE